MERPRLPAEGRVNRLGLGEQLELAQKVLRMEVVTAVIDEGYLRSYLDAASKTGFTVTKIAGEGEDFPALYSDRDGGKIVSNVKVQGKYNLAVAIEKPAGSKNHSSFWNNLSPGDYIY